MIKFKVVTVSIDFKRLLDKTLSYYKIYKLTQKINNHDNWHKKWWDGGSKFRILKGKFVSYKGNYHADVYLKPYFNESEYYNTIKKLSLLVLKSKLKYQKNLTWFPK